MKNTTTQTIENQQVMTNNTFAGHVFEKEINQMIETVKQVNQANEQPIDMDVKTSNDYSYSTYVGGKLSSQHAKINQTWESIEEFFTSPEMIERFECYDNVRKEQFNNAIKGDQENRFKFIKGLQIGDKLFKIYEVIEQGIIMSKEITIGSMMSNSPFQIWSFNPSFTSVSIYPRNFTKDFKHRSEIAKIMSKMNSNSTLLNTLNDQLI